MITLDAKNNVLGIVKTIVTPLFKVITITLAATAAKTIIQIHRTVSLMLTEIVNQNMKKAK